MVDRLFGDDAIFSTTTIHRSVRLLFARTTGSLGNDNNSAERVYAFQSRIGYMLTTATANTIAVYDCYITDWLDHMIDDDANCGNPVVQNWGRMGWISTQSFMQSVAIYRCYDAATTDHFISLDPNCNGKTAEWRIGYFAKTPTAVGDKLFFLPIILRNW